MLACEGRSVSPVRGGRSGLASTHSAGPPGGGRHDHVFGDRVAQSEDRARPLAGSCRMSELTRGLVTLPVGGGAAALGVWAAWAVVSRW
jgi:hypothetical protein